MSRSPGPIKRSKDGIIQGIDWDALADLTEFFTALTNPPDGMFKVKNLYVELVEGKPKLRVEFDDGESE